MKTATCGHGNTLMVCIEHRWTIFYQEEKLRVQKEKWWAHSTVEQDPDQIWKLAFEFLKSSSPQ